MPTLSTRFHVLLQSRDGRSPAVSRALDRAVLLLTRALGLSPPMAPMDLMKPGHLCRAMRALAGIEGHIPVSMEVIQGYASWLGQWRTTGRPVIAIDARLLRASLSGPTQIRMTRAGSKLLAVTAHEVGHLLMDDPGKPREFVTDMGTWVASKPESLLAEAEAWLFAGLLRGFVFADIGSEKRPDETHLYA